jgi:hypothetical protein
MIMAEMLYKVRSMFSFDINDLFHLGRNLDDLRKYAGDKKWRVVKEKDGTVLDYHGDDLLSKTTYISEMPPHFFRAMVVITGLEAHPFDLTVTLESKGHNKTMIEYLTRVDLPPDYDHEVIRSTIDEFRSALFAEFAKAAKAKEAERRKKETAVPFEDVKN